MAKPAWLLLGAAAAVLSALCATPATAGGPAGPDLLEWQITIACPSQATVGNQSLPVALPCTSGMQSRVVAAADIRGQPVVLKGPWRRACQTRSPIQGVGIDHTNQIYGEDIRFTVSDTEFRRDITFTDPCSANGRSMQMVVSWKSEPYGASGRKYMLWIGIFG